MKENYFTADNLKKVSLAMRDRAAVCYGDLSTFRPEKSALLILDMQKYFLDPASHSYIPSAPAIVPGLAGLAERYREEDLCVILTRHLNTADDAGMMNKWWAEVISREDALSELESSFVSKKGLQVEKSQYDAFYNTKLEDTLKSKGITQVVIGGVMTHLCCETTARSAFMRGFEVFFLVDGTATYNAAFHKATLVNLAHGFANLVTVDEIMGGLMHVG